MKRNWKVPNSLTGKNKKSVHKEFIVDGVSTNNSIIICDAFCYHFIDQPRNVHGSISISTSHHFDQIENNERSIYFRNATDTDLIESIIRLNKEGSINDISRKILVVCKNYVSYYLRKKLFNFSIISGVYLDIF